MKCKALQPMTWVGKNYAAGEEILNLTGSEANYLESIGAVRVMPEPLPVEEAFDRPAPEPPKKPAPPPTRGTKGGS